MANVVARVENGHLLELGWFFEQGGGIDEYWVWCHTCDPTGSELIKVDAHEFSQEDALRYITDLALRHSESSPRS